MSETTREKLLAEAEVLVRKRGWSGFSYADLAAAVGLRKASIHHHFHVKEDLGIALIEAYGLRYDQALAQIIASSADGLARVEAYAKLYLHGLELEQGCLAAAMAAELGTLPPRIRDGVAAFFQRHIAWLHQILAEGQINGTIGDDVDPDQSARMIVATLEGALMMERLLGGAPGFEAALAALRKSLK